MCKIIDTRGLGLDDFLADNNGGWTDIPNLKTPRPKAKKPKPGSRQSAVTTSRPKACSVGKPALVVNL